MSALSLESPAILISTPLGLVCRDGPSAVDAEPHVLGSNVVWHLVEAWPPKGYAYPDRTNIEDQGPGTHGWIYRFYHQSP